MIKSITVFTPSYNRAHLLPRLYESLKNQTSKDFVWMVIDDGSTDNTKSLVAQWREEADFEIQYHYKENGGMHTAHNLAYSLIQTELNVCIDSDDYMPTNAVELILSLWENNKYNNDIAGLIGLDADFENNILGTAMPIGVKTGTLSGLYKKYKAKGDKKLVIKTSIVREFPAYPEFEDEKLVPLGTLYLMIDQHYQYIYVNEMFCNVEYQPNGSTKSIIRQYKQSPKGFAYARKLKLRYESSFSEIIKNCIHLVSHGITTKSVKTIFENNPYKFLTVFLLPCGLLLDIYIKIKAK
ncbi:glycosyltransferase family 2 protein [Soonwooa purpurea]